jgi:LPXTG-site transpeptidase (sortase) family protein
MNSDPGTTSDRPASEDGEAGTTSASPSRVDAQTPRGKGRIVAGALCAVAAVALAITALVLRNRADDELVLETTPATLAPELMPSTAAPVATPPNSTQDSTVPTETTLPLSPLAEQLGNRYSAIPPPVVDLPTPVNIRIDAIDVDTDPVIPVGVTPIGSLDVPGADEVGWYRLGQYPGQSGATVLAAHVSWKGDLGVFNKLGKLEPGSEIFVTLSDGSVRRYIAWERTIYDKTGLPYERIWTREGDEVLVLITCGGEFNPEIRRYKQNIVVYAVPVPLETPTPSPEG